jgi:hypothetical protein
VGDLPWEAVAELRRDRNIAGLRAVLREVEVEAADDAANGDIERAEHRAYERHLAAASGKIDSLGAAVKKTGGSIIISGSIGAATSPITGPLGIIVGTAIGGVVTAVDNLRNRSRQRRSKGWVSLTQRIDRAA